jgi:ribonuclease VapC
MVVDSSAVLACCLGEPGYQAFEKVLTQGLTLYMSAPTRLEVSVVAMMRNMQAKVDFSIQNYQIQIEPFTESQAHIAIAAYRQYGKGRHPAALNFGDCCAYALAKSLELPLLYKGKDFAQTDITSALE